MKVTIKTNDNNVTAYVAGRIDSATAPELEKALDEAVTPVSWVTLDFEKLDYISSAGLRVVLKTCKKVTGKGSLHIVHVNETVKDVFDITGLSEVLTIL